jgi:hypothetical protein
MKHLLLLLLCCYAGYGQVQMNADEKEILKLEVLRCKDDFINKYHETAVTGDSIVISKDVLKNFKSAQSYKKLSIYGEIFSIAEAEEVFGSDRDTLFTTSLKTIGMVWNRDNFQGYKVFLFDEAKHSSAYASVKDKGVKIGIGTYSILSISKPVIRSDGKFAIIETASNHFGGVLSIYIKRNDKWELYKEMQLYYI